MAGAIALTRGNGISPVTIGALLGLAVAKLTTQTVRRVHNCGQSGWIGLATCAGIVALLASALLRWLDHGVDALTAGLIAVTAAASATLLLRPGQSSVNRHGTAATEAPRPSPIGAVAAVVWVTGGIACGFAALSWQAGMDRQREMRMTMPEPPPSSPSPATSTRRTGVDARNEELSDRIDALLKTKDAE